MKYYIVPLILLLFSLVSCEKEITVDLPEAQKKIVVEGTILPGEFPLVLLSWTQGYFDPTDINCNPSVQPGMTWLRGNVAGSPPSVLSKILPSSKVPL